MIALARSGRQVIIETHSDHLVRRLRGLVARAARGSESEAWLLANVRVAEIEQDACRATVVASATLAALVEMMRESGLQIPFDHLYWPRLSDEYLAPLARRMRGDRRYSEHLRKLRGMASPVELPSLPVGDTLQVKDFDLMFGELGPSWVETMRAVVTGCVLRRDTVLVTCLITGRNARPSDHPDYEKVFVEKRCWELQITVGQRRALHVPCVCSVRNLKVAWTRRYSEQLPAHEDGARFPFCPPDDWRDPSCVAWRTHQARPAWRDKFDCFWAEPRAQNATDTCEHWDVYLDRNQDRLKRYRENYLNISRWRPDRAAGLGIHPGEIHHPEALRRKKWPGWECRMPN